MPATVQITFDAVDPNALARWWAALIDYHVEVDHDFVAGLLEQGAITEDEVIEIDGIFHFATAASIVDPDDRGP